MCREQMWHRHETISPPGFPRKAAMSSWESHHPTHPSWRQDALPLQSGRNSTALLWMKHTSWSWTRESLPVLVKVLTHLWYWRKKCNPLQYSWLGDPKDRGDWWATVHGGHKELDTTEHTQGQTSDTDCMCHWHHLLSPLSYPWMVHSIYPESKDRMKLKHREVKQLDWGHTARGVCFHQGWADLRFCTFPPSALHVSLPWTFGSYRYSQALWPTWFQKHMFSCSSTCVFFSLTINQFQIIGHAISNLLSSCTWNMYKPSGDCRPHVEISGQHSVFS